jgi:DNA polymerase beta
MNINIIEKLNELKKIYEKNPEKKWNLKALSTAIELIKKYPEKITSGKILKKELKGIGDKIAVRIDEILETNSLKEVEIWKKENNSEIEDNNNKELSLVTGVGNTRIKTFNSLGIYTLNDLKKAIQEKKIKTTHHIDIGIKYFEDLLIKIPRDEINKIKDLITPIIKNIDKDFIFEICGSYRRGLIESSDIDILISNTKYPQNISKQNFLKLIIKKLKDIDFIIDSLTINGDTKFMGICRLNKSCISRRIDIRMVDYDSYFTSILYFTGNKDFNIYIRNKALEKNYSLSEYSLKNLNDSSPIYLNCEKELFDLLNLEYVQPDKRNENTY